MLVGMTIRVRRDERGRARCSARKRRTHTSARAGPVSSSVDRSISLLYVRSGQNSTGGGGRRSEHESRLVALPRLRVRADHALTRAEVSAPALA